jgi:hypothetical protein
LLRDEYIQKLLYKALDSFIASSTSVAMAIDVFHKKLNYDAEEIIYKVLAKIVAAQLCEKYWSNSFWPKYDPLVLMYSILKNILTILDLWE